VCRDAYNAPSFLPQSLFHHFTFPSSFERHLKVNGATMHLSHEPAQRMFVDWAGDSAEVVDGIAGAISKA